MKKAQLLLLVAAASITLSAAPIRSLSGLTGIKFYEVTTIVTPYTFTPNATQMTTAVNGAVTATNADFSGAPSEYYDVFYSNANGTFNIDGEYISITADYPGPGAGLNISEVELLFGSGPSILASSVASFFTGAGYISGSVNNIIDGNFTSSTAMGTTDEGRMRVTVGFNQAPPPTGVPEPSSFVLGALGVAGILGLKSRRRSRA